jgi:hypothetical protein
MKNIYSLLVAQVLLMKAGSRLKLKAVFQPGESYFRFRVLGRRGISPKLTMPVIHSESGTSILSLLDETNSAQRTWLINGQADVGMKQVAHYGDVGKAWFMNTGEAVAIASNNPDRESVWGTCNHSYEELMDNPVLVIRDQNDMPEVILLPSEETISALHQALEGKDPVHVGDEVDRYRDLVKTFGLGLYFGKGLLAGYMFSSEWVKYSQETWVTRAAFNARDSQVSA